MGISRPDSASPCKAIALAVLLLLAISGTAGARLNVSQRKETFLLGDPAASGLRTYLATEPDPAQPIPAKLARELATALPSRLKNSCSEALEAWRSGAGVTATLALRVLSRDAAGVWLALRCSSSRRDLAQYYDERLLVFRPKTATGELIPFDLDAENDSTLYHIEFQEQVLTNAGPAAVFRIVADSENPCCDGPTRFREEKLLILSDASDGVKQLFATALRREQDNHDDVEGDSHTVYVAKVTFERDDRQQLETIGVKFNEEENGKARRSGINRYGWDADSGNYVEKE